MLGMGGLLRFLDFDSEPPRKTEFDLGLASNYTMDSRTVLPSIPALLMHTQSGFAALSLVCTHLGCTVDEQPGGFVCPCHGSRFDAQGQVLGGPAVRPLRTLRMELTEDGRLLLHTD
jgi:Rieske Fe-S protein